MRCMIGRELTGQQQRVQNDTFPASTNRAMAALLRCFLSKHRPRPRCSDHYRAGIFDFMKPLETPQCLDCRHCKSMSDDAGWIMWTFFPIEPWCCVGQHMVGTQVTTGTDCWKMRTEGICGPSAKLFEPTL